jgi:lipopolysaccharide/colanic/teichoic acid biosynthesis glycosyltransferase
MHPIYSSFRYQVWIWVERLMALVLLICLLPLFVVLYLAVRLTSRGPFLYSQQRPGLGGVEFRIWKIRTMAVGSDKHVSNAFAVQKNNPHVTKVGKILRDLKIDELPQLWNVVCGQMELVGPRPIAKALYDRLQMEIPGFSVRNTIRPGLTNLGQITILDNEAASRLRDDWKTRFEGECHYLQNKSVFYDVVLLFLTVVFICRKALRRLGRGGRSALASEPLASRSAPPAETQALSAGPPS